MADDVGVVVVAAGQGRRLGGTTPKQYREVAGVPLLLHALRPFTSHRDVAHVVVVVPRDDLANPPEWLGQLTGDRLTLAAGGAERADSVAAGLEALPPNCQVVLVHDGARPFPAAAVIDTIIARARDGVSAIAALPVTDTVKEAEGDPPRVVATIPRDRLWRAQTPQGFPRKILEQAHAEAGRRSATDDAALVEAAGFPVLLVPDSPSNLKVTTEEDLALAAAILSLA